MSRSCGGCTMCCKVVGVLELDKPPGTWCPHCAIGRGCQIYETRPPGCRDFECMWLQIEGMPEELRPDRSKVVLAMTTNNENIVAYLAPHDLHLLDEGPMARFLAQAPEHNMGVIAVIGKDRRMIVHMTQKMAHTLLLAREQKLVSIEGRDISNIEHESIEALAQAVEKKL